MLNKATIRLTIEQGPMKGKVFDFEEHDTFVFGRMPDCHCHLPDDPCVSRHHFLIEVNPPDCCLSDLGSLNGTHINGKKHGGRKPDEMPQEAARRAQVVNLKDGDIIRTGDTVFRVSVFVPCAKCGKALDAQDRAEAGPGAPKCRACRKTPKDKQSELLAGILAGARKADKQKAGIPGYRIEKKLGEGGMGQVYLAHSEKLNRQVALKTMLPGRSAIDEAAVKRFLREVATCAALKHPNIVAFLDQGYSNGVFYFAMEYCKDGSVHDLLTRSKGPLPLAISVGIISQVLDGLGYAHEKGIVHRDLKPSNILLVRMGSNLTALIADFGLAKNFQRAGLSGMTMSGACSGTLPFMPPEQVVNFRDVNPVADIFSAGATLYVMLTGQCVYDFKEGEDQVRALLEKRIVPIRKRRVKLPEKLMDVVDRATQAEPEKRFQSVKEMKAAVKKAM